jgi:acetate---CoA ligase (ADP-forming)
LNDMEFFFNPRAVAVVGASAVPTKGGYTILKNLMNGFKGDIYPVNPRYREIEGLRCYESVRQVPAPVDLAIVFVPADRVPGVVGECAECKISGIMVQSAGFAESGDKGKHLQETVKALCREAGIRLWGPNCMGLVDAVHKHVFSFVSPVIWEEGLLAGNVSLIVQSGLLSAGFLIDMMTHGTMGISKACSIGNKADVDECDLLAYLLDDPDTGSIGLYLESIPDGRRFMELCRRSGKPITVLKGGRSRKGAAAALSHTASLAGDGAVIHGALAQVGVVEATDFKQMMDLCRALAMVPEVSCREGARIAVLTYSGAAGIVSADLIDRHGLRLAELSPDTLGSLKRIFPEWMPVNNPVDLWPAIELHGAQEVYSRAIRAACADPNVDALLVHFFVGGFAMNADLTPLAQITQAAGKPMFCWLLGTRSEVRKFHRLAQQTGIPVFGEVQRAVECLAAVSSRNKPGKSRPVQILSGEAFSLSEPCRRVLERESGPLDEHVSKRILSELDIPVVQERLVSTLAEARQAVQEFGFPVVMKGLSPGKIHKTELGLVRTGLASLQAVEASFTALKDSVSDKGSVLIQRHVKGEPELIAGLIRDPQFGPCLLCGLGGVMAEVFKDTAFAVAPITPSEAADLIGRLRNQRLLNGFRGSLPVDRDMLAQILVHLGELGRRFPRIREIDINPLIVNAGKPVAVDATIVLGD